MSIVFDQVQAEIAAPPAGEREPGGLAPRPSGGDDPAAVDRLQRALERRRGLETRLAAD